MKYFYTGPTIDYLTNNMVYETKDYSDDAKIVIISEALEIPVNISLLVPTEDVIIIKKETLFNLLSDTEAELEIASTTSTRYSLTNKKELLTQLLYGRLD